ncbi:hypothetical protein ABPG72_007913 [Tetrahymena utriculariae]
MNLFLLDMLKKFGKLQLKICFKKYDQQYQYFKYNLKLEHLSFEQKRINFFKVQQVFFHELKVRIQKFEDSSQFIAANGIKKLIYFSFHEVVPYYTREFFSRLFLKLNFQSIRGGFTNLPQLSIYLFIYLFKQHLITYLIYHSSQVYWSFLFFFSLISNHSFIFGFVELRI